MNDYNALLHRILRGLAQADAATIDNVFACLVRAQNAMDGGSRAAAQSLRATASIYRSATRRNLNRAAQHLWGSTPPEGIRVDDRWHYTVTA